jgi:acyl-CoA ligase (AMP-forming) (exosortase A-associated)
MGFPEFTLAHLLLNTVEGQPERCAIVDGSRRYAYGDLWRDASRLATCLREHGVRRGDRLGIYLDKSWEAVVAIFAAAKIGAVFVVLNPLLKEPQVRHIMDNCGLRALIADSAKVQKAALPDVDVTFYRGADAPQVSWSKRVISLDRALADSETASDNINATETDLASIIYTSGSTGLPKGIMLTHHNLVAGAQIVSQYLQNTRDDRVLSILPFNFDYGLNQLVTMARVGGTLALQRSLMPGDILQSLRREKITGLAGVPTLWPILLQNRRSIEQQPLECLRYITNSGGMIPGAHFDQLRKLLPTTKIFLMYGLTEAFRSTYLPPEDAHRGPSCIGKAIPNTDIWVVNEKGQECAPDEVGELIHRGPTVSLGYWADPEKTQAVFRPNPFAPAGVLGRDTVIYSGDLVKRDADGYLYFVGRRDELIKTQGYRVSPQEVEDLLCGMPEVSEAVAFGQYDNTLGQRIAAVVSLKKGSSATPEAVQRWCAEKAPQYLVPREIHVMSELPRTSTGKIDRSELKRAYAAK